MIKKLLFLLFAFVFTGCGAEPVKEDAVREKPVKEHVKCWSNRASANGAVIYDGYSINEVRPRSGNYTAFTGSDGKPRGIYGAVCLVEQK